MGQKLLVAVDESTNALRCADFVAKSFSADNRVTLFSVLPDTAAVCDMNSPELTAYFNQQKAQFCLLEAEKKKLMEKALASARKVLLDAGFPEQNVKVKLENRRAGVAQDIVTEAAGGYDMIIMGRRGLSGLKEIFMGSVSQKVLHLAKDISILIVN